MEVLTLIGEGFSTKRIICRTFYDLLKKPRASRPGF